MSGVRDHHIYCLAIRATHDIVDDDNTKIGEKETIEVVHVVAETPQIAMAWAYSGTRAFAGRNRHVEIVTTLTLAAIITTEIY